MLVSKGKNNIFCIILRNHKLPQFVYTNKISGNYFSKLKNVCVGIDSLLALLSAKMTAKSKGTCLNIPLLLNKKKY